MKDIVKSIVKPLQSVVEDSKSIFSDKSEMHDDADDSEAVIPNAVTLMPGKDLNRLLSLSFELASVPFWISGEVNFKIIQELKELVLHFQKREIQGPKVHLQLGRLDNLKSTLSIPGKHGLMHTCVRFSIKTFSVTNVNHILLIV